MATHIFTPIIGSDIMVYDENSSLAFVAKNAFNIVFSDESVTRTKGFEKLEFEITNASTGFSEVRTERKVEFGGRWFRIKLLSNAKYSKSVTKVTCYALWNEMSEGPEIKMAFKNTTLAVVLDTLSTGTNIRFEIPSNLQSQRVQGLTGKRNSVLYHYRYILKQYGLETRFAYKVENGNIVVIAIPQKPQVEKVEWPLVIAKTVSDIKRTEDSRDLCTRYTLIGKTAENDDLTIASINPSGAEYLEDFSWFDKVKQPRRIIPVTREDDRFKDPESIKIAMESYLSIYSRPFVSYEVKAILYKESGIPELLSSQLILDDSFLITEWRKVSSRAIQYSDLQRSSIVFEDPRQDLIDILTGEDAY